MALTLKKTSIFVLILSCNSGFSGTMGAEPTTDPYNGFYVGADIGVSDIQDKTAHYVSPEIHDLGGIGIVGGGLIGYDFSITERLKLGIEGFGNATGLNSSIQHYNQTTSVQDNSEQFSNRYNAGVRILPGYQYTPDTEGHLLIGYSNASFKHTDNGTYGYLDSRFNKNGFQGGVGWKSAFFSPHTLLRLDVLYTRYTGQSSTGTGLPGSGSAYQYYSDVFSTLEADLSLIYKFS